MSRPHLNRALTLEEAVDLPDGAGGFTRSWQALGVLWAELRPGSGRERAGDGAALSLSAYRITLRAAPVGHPTRPRPDQRFRDGTRLFRILAVAEADTRGRYLLCTAQEEVVT